MACGNKEFDPPFLFPPGESRGGRVSPHAGSTLRASKKRWHASMLPAPPTRGLPPPCASPASVLSHCLNRARKLDHQSSRRAPAKNLVDIDRPSHGSALPSSD